MSARKTNAATYQILPVGLDRTDRRVMDHNEAIVHIVQPYGCPKNGTMGMVYVQEASSGYFIGLVLRASLVKTGKTAPVRDLAAGMPRPEID